MFAARKCLFFIMMVGGGLGAPFAEGQEAKLATLLQKAPSGVNAVGYVNPPALKKLMSEANFQSSLSDNVEEVWLASAIDPISLVHQWEAGFAQMDRALSAEALAQIVGGYVDRVADKDVVWTPKQSYLVPSADNRIGFLRPAKRSLLASWLSGARQPAPPSYLVQQARQPEEFLSFFFAIDLQDSFSPVPLAKRLADFDALDTIEKANAASILASIRGVTILVGRRSLKECILSAEFATSPEPLVGKANAILTEILNRNGTGAPEVADWKVTVKGNTLSFQGAISEDTLHGLLGIFSVQGQAENLAKTAPATGEAATPNAPAEPTVYESKKYFDDVAVLIERVRKYDTKSTGYRARWNDMQARRIDELPTLRVDPVLIQYSTDVATLLRNNALTIRGGNIQASQVKASQTLSSGYYGYGDGYYDPNSGVDYQRVTDVQARGAASMDYNSTLAAIDKLTGDIRRAMTQKYQSQF